MDQPLHVIFMVSACAVHQHEGLCVTFAFAAIAALPRARLGSSSPKPQAVFATSPSSAAVSPRWKNELCAQIPFSEIFCSNVHGPNGQGYALRQHLRSGIAPHVQYGFSCLITFSVLKSANAW